MTHPSIHAQKAPEKAAYVMADSGATLTFRELDERSNQGAHLLRSLGVKQGDHIALMLENCLVFAEICWAAQRAGVYYTAISRYLTNEEVAYIVEDCEAKVFIVSPATVESTRTVDANGVKLFMLGGHPDAGYESWEEATAEQLKTPIADEALGTDMLYSSGTTGRPKGVQRPFEKKPIEELNPLLKLLCHDMAGIAEATTYLSPAPLYHAAPLRFTMMQVALGGTAVVMEKFDAERYLQIVEQRKISHTQLVPTMFIRMLKLPEDVRKKYDVSSLRGAVHAAAPCPADVKQAMIDWWGPILFEYYAGTEGNGIVFCNSKEWLAHRGTVGKCIVGAVRILGEDGEELPPGEIGTVYFDCGQTFAYHNDPEKTKTAFNDKGWSTLGDVGYLDADKYLHLTDRKAYMIISGGVNIYPQETEDVLVGHPAVSDVAVFGVPNAEMGEEVKAVVQPRDMSEAGPELAAQLIAWCRERLSPIKCPRTIDFNPALPRTPTGKLVKRTLRDEYWKHATKKI